MLQFNISFYNFHGLVAEKKIVRNIFKIEFYKQRKYMENFIYL